MSGLASAAKLMSAAMDAVLKGAQLITVLDTLADVRDRMKADDRADATDADMDLVRGRIEARQERINQTT